MFDQSKEHDDFYYDSQYHHALRQAEINADEAHNTDSAWLLTDFDTWVRNPFYTGTDFTHPDDYR